MVNITLPKSTHFSSTSPQQFVNTSVDIANTLTPIFAMKNGEKVVYELVGDKPLSTTDSVNWNMQVLHNNVLILNIALPNTRLSANQFNWKITITRRDANIFVIESQINSTTSVWNTNMKDYYKVDTGGIPSGILTDQFKLRVAHVNGVNLNFNLVSYTINYL